MQVLFLTAPMKERIWGGDYFKRLNRTEKDNIGELWSASAHKEGESIVTNGKYEGMKLSEVYNNHPELFNNPSLKEFPILVKIIYAKDPLSVQVHPNDEYALKYENQYGKTEGWLVLDALKDSKLVLGHNAKNKEELVSYIENDDYDGLLKSVDVNVGEFYPIYAGTVHAIGAGLTILEIQQSSDVTYRFYDYHRKDAKGNERELHVQQAVSVTTYDSQELDRTNHLELPSHMVWDNEYFTVSMLNVKEDEVLANPETYAIFTVATGEFELDGKKLVVGDSFILTKLADNVTIKGNGVLVRTDAK